MLRVPLGAAGFLALDLLNYVPWGAPRGHWDLANRGWTQICTTGPGTINGYRTLASYTSINCDLAMVHVPTNATAAGLDIASNVLTLFLGQFNSAGNRINLLEKWTRTTTGVVPYAPPQPAPAAPPYEVPPYPALDPFPYPIGVPVPTPRPIPYRVIPERRPNPDRSPQEQPTRGPSPSPAPRPRPVPRPSQQPAYEWVLTPGGKGAPRPRPAGRQNFHVLRPPSQGEREKKSAMGVNPASLLGKVLSAATESNDFLNAAYKSLEPDVQRELRRDARPFEKLLHLLRNLDSIRPGSFLANLLSENLEDKAFGKMGKLGQKALRKAYDAGLLPQGSRGYETGPYDSPVGPANGKGGAGDLNRDPYVEWLNDQLEGALR